MKKLEHACYVLAGVLMTTMFYVVYLLIQLENQQEADNDWVDTLDVNAVNESYEEVSRLFEGDDKYVVSALGIDYACQDYVKDKDEQTRIDLCKHSKRNVNSLAESEAWLSGVVENEGLTLGAGTTDKDWVASCEMKLPEGLDLELSEDENYVYGKGTFGVAGDAIKIPYEDGVHYIVFLSGEGDFPQESEFSFVDSTVRLPRVNSESTLSITRQGIGSVGEFISFKILGDKYVENNNTEYQVADSYRFKIYNVKTKILVAAGQFVNSSE